MSKKYTIMEKKKQNCIDWLENELKERYSLMNSEPLFEQAKAMHKEEMQDLYLSHVTKATRLREIFEKQFEELYNETFKTKNYEKEALIELTNIDLKEEK